MYNFEDYAIKLRHELQAMSRLARELMLKSKEMNKRVFDKTARPQNFELDDCVLLKKEARNKFEPIYEGPFRISELRGKNVILNDEKGNFKAEVHRDRIIRYYG